MPLADLARSLHEHERHGVGPGALLVAADRLEHRLDVDALEPHREPALGEQPSHLLSQRVLPGEAQGGQQAEADGLAVAVARVAGRGLDRVADRVPEVQHLPAPAVALVGGDDRELRRARRRTPSTRRPPRPMTTRSHSSPPAISAVFSTSTHPAASSSGGSVRSASGIDEHAGRLVVGADVVLRRRQVDAGLAAVRRVDLRDERGRDLHDRHAALVGRRAEAREVADDAAAERDEVIGSRHARAGERGPHAIGGGERLALLAGRDRDGERGLPERLP